MLAARNQPADSFAAILKMARLCSAIVGADVADPNYRINWVTCIAIGSIVGYFIFSIITIIDVYKEQPTFILEASCMLGSVLQGTTKLCTGISRTKCVVKMRYELEQLYAEYQVMGTKYCVALKKNCNRLGKIIKLMGVIYFLCISGVVVVPFMLLLFSGKRYLMMHFLVPGLDVNTNFGFFGTMAAHSVCMFCGGFGLFAGDLFFFIYAGQAFLFADIFSLKIEHLNVCLANGTPAFKLKYMLKDIIKWHKKYSNYNNFFNNLFKYIITVQVTTSGISILCSLFIILNGDWPGVYMYMFLPLISLYSFCVMGTQITICNDRFTCDIFSIDWFLLPIEAQKEVKFMLLSSQSPATISIVGVMPLNVDTALQISKTIYSIFMMMVQVLIE